MKSKEMSQLAELTYAHTLVIVPTHEWVTSLVFCGLEPGSYGTWKVGTIWPTCTFNGQSMSID